MHGVAAGGTSFVLGVLVCFVEEIYLRPENFSIQPVSSFVTKYYIVCYETFVDNFDQSFCGSDFWNFSRRSVFLVVDPDVFNKLLL